MRAVTAPAPFGEAEDLVDVLLEALERYKTAQRVLHD
jgi:hypothetical protein